ncbi:MAG TPA: DedA family protein [Fimbriimonadales bacterium]|nr:DedA family protein [Fimbriimonadales bacterium]
MIDFFLHLDQSLDSVIQTYQGWTYLILFGVIFAETGLVIAPFLPGDSLLFAAGMFSHRTEGGLNPLILFVVLAAGAVLGDSTNYFIGKYLGPRLFRNEKSRFLKRENLAKTHAFFEKYGSNAIIFGRFVPIVRTFTPFVAGLGAMTYRRFIVYSLVGSSLWVGVCVAAGYLFGQIRIVRENFSVAILAIVLVTIIPAAIEILRHRRKARRVAEETD